MKAVNRQIHWNLEKEKIKIPQGLEMPEVMSTSISHNFAAYMDPRKRRKTRFKNIHENIRKNVSKLAKKLKADKGLLFDDAITETEARQIAQE